MTPQLPPLLLEYTSPPRITPQTTSVLYTHYGRLNQQICQYYSSLDEEIRLVSAAVLQAASSTLPPHKKPFSHDPEFRDLSRKCKSAVKVWKKAGHPSQGPEHQEKKRLSHLTRNVLTNVALTKNGILGRREKKCSRHDSRHFKTPSNPLKIQSCWSNHFKTHFFNLKLGPAQA